MDMRKGILLLCIAVLVAVHGFAQTAKAEWIEQVHDFGAFDEDMGKVTCRFPFVNTGKVPLSIISARATCGCTTPRFSNRPIEPGDTGFVEVAYNPTGRPGRFDKKIYVEMNTLPKKTTLIVRGVVIGSSNTLRSRYPVEAGPVKLKTSVVPFGELLKGKTKARFLDFYNTTADTLRPYFLNLPDYLTATLRDGYIAPGDYAAYSLQLDTSKVPEFGLLTDSIVFVPDKAYPEESVTLSVVAMIAEDFSNLTPGQRRNAPVICVIPDAVDCGTVYRDGGLITKTLQVKNLGKDPLKIHRVYSADRGIEVRVSSETVKKNRSAVITLTVDPAAFPSDILDARISIISNAPDNPVKPIRIVGEIKE